MVRLGLVRSQRWAAFLPAFRVLFVLALHRAGMVFPKALYPDAFGPSAPAGAVAP